MFPCLPLLQRLATTLKRPVSSNAIIEEVEGLRFVAIAGVLLMHLGTQILRINPSLRVDGDWAYRATKNGGLGVSLFFSISGYILAYPFAKHFLFGKPIRPLPAFYLKRVTRLEPPFVINVILLFAAQLVMTPGSLKQPIPHLISTLTYTHYFIFNTWSNINPVTWSLETEIQFYLFAPFIFVALYSLRRRWLRVGLLLSAIALINVGHDYFNWQQSHLAKSLLYYLDNFLVGILFLELFLWEGFMRIRSSLAWDIVTLCSMVLFFGFVTELSPIPRGVILDACIFGMFAGAFKGSLSNRVFRLPALTTIGGMCYTIYLYHYAIFAFLSRYTARLPVHSGWFWQQYLVQGPIVVALTLGICGALFSLFEKPFMVKHWYRRKNKVAATGE